MMQETLLLIPVPVRKHAAPGPSRRRQAKEERASPCPSQVISSFSFFFPVLCCQTQWHRGAQTLINTGHDSAGLAGATPCGSAWHASARQFFTLPYSPRGRPAAGLMLLCCWHEGRVSLGAGLRGS